MVVNPPISGDQVVDSWAFQLTNQLNAALARIDELEAQLADHESRITTLETP